MLFPSFEFLFVFLPVVYALWLGSARWPASKVPFVALASFAFYSWSGWHYTLLLAGSISVNYALGRLLLRDQRRAWLALAISLNVGVLAYFKYAGLSLPLGISFFTFQQVGYLVDAYRAKRGEMEYGFVEYAFFVSFFPQLIAGPITRHREIIPQLRDGSLSFREAKFSRGLVYLALGFGKKLLIADPIAPLVAVCFDGNVALTTPTTVWIGAVAYTVQLYFDFSGYADMAVGLGLLFGIELPLNFESPMKATSIIDFWRRWHISLSRFLRDYVYYPLGGSRCSRPRHYLNLFLTFLLCGLWHGAGPGFLIWGALQGIYLITNHAFRLFVEPRWRTPRHLKWLSVASSWLLTFLSIVGARVFFRAASVGDALTLLGKMAQFDLDRGFIQRYFFHAILPVARPLNYLDFSGVNPHFLMMTAFFISVLAPNSRQIALAYPRLPRLVGAWCGLVFAFALWRVLFGGQVSVFIYFRF